MKKVNVFASLLILLILPLLTFSQQKDAEFGINFSGYVKNDIMFDSRQTVTYREGHFLLFPANELKDVNGEDINAKPNFNMLSIQTRLIGKLTGPEAFGAKTSGLIETEFFGTADADINGFRLRRAFVKLDWENTTLLVGQEWHPMFVLEVFPGVVSFNTGAPFQPFTRNPQIRLVQSMDNLKIIAALISQRDFQSNGPAGFTSTYLRNSVIPNIHFQLQVKAGDNIFGAGADYKMLTPLLSTSKNYKTDETIGSFSALGYMKLSFNPVIFKLEGIWGKNLADMLMLGGYAVKSIDSKTGEFTYTPLGCFSIWGEISGGKEIETGLFFGYTENLGADDNIVGASYLRANNIKNIFRVSPRIQFNSGKTRISTEVEYTSAAYGTQNNLNKGKVENTKAISDLRILLGVYYFF